MNQNQRHCEKPVHISVLINRHLPEILEEDKKTLDMQIEQLRLPFNETTAPEPVLEDTSNETTSNKCSIEE